MESDGEEEVWVGVEQGWVLVGGRGGGIYYPLHSLGQVVVSMHIHIHT